MTVKRATSEPVLNLSRRLSGTGVGHANEQNLISALYIYILKKNSEEK